MDRPANTDARAPASRRESLDFELLYLLEKEPGLSQREIADRLGLSLGKVNYCLKGLVDKGAIKLDNFRASRNKLRYVYMLTPQGISQRLGMTQRFLRRKLAEYERLRAQIEALESELPHIPAKAATSDTDAFPDPMHILATVNAAWNMWNFRRPVLAALLADGHRVTVLAPEDEEVAKLEHMGCRFLPLVMDQKGLNPLRDAALMRRLRRAFNDERPDVILSYTIKNNIYGAFAARSLRIPFIPNVSGLGTAFLSGGALQFLAERLYREAFKTLPTVFFQNNDDRELFVGRGLVRRAQTGLLPGSGIDLDHFAPAAYPGTGTPATFLMIARLLRDKGVYEFVEAARVVRRLYPQTRFQLLGAVDAQNRTAINEATALGWQQTRGIEYLGACPDVREYIARAHCVVLPSYREGAPRTLIEAAAMARPLIASDVPGCRSVVDDGVNGFLCLARSGDSLAAACLGFLGLSRDTQIAMGKAGRAKMESEFAQERVVEAYRMAIAGALR